MFERCPKCRHAPLPTDQSLPAACPACGVILAKLAAASQPREEVQTLVHPAPQPADPLALGGRVLLWMAFAVWGWVLLREPLAEGMDSFIRRPLLVFHEAGHVLFMPFGEWMTVFGGSFTQLLVPAVLAGALLWKNHDAFGASLGLWLLGISCLDVATYVHDAYDPRLVLLGGRTGQDGPHDWLYLLRTLGLREQARGIGRAVHLVGGLVVVGSLVWGAVVLWRQWRDPDRHAS